MSQNTATATPLLPETARNQRIVLEHTRGPYKGLKQITGHTDQFGGQQPPAITSEFDITPGNRKGVASLVASRPRFLLYREIFTPEGMKGFDRGQR
jgi:hypothetical protein